MTAEGTMALEKLSVPAELSILKVDASGVWQEKYCTVTSYAPDRTACPAEGKSSGSLVWKFVWFHTWK